MSLLHACTFLFTPGNAPQRFEKGLRSRADGVVLDLEDAVAVQDKDLARQQVFDWLVTHAHSLAGDNQAMVAVRLNPMGSVFFPADEAALLNALRSGHGPDGVMMPKVESASEMAKMLERWGAQCERLPWVMALIETARGLEHVAAIAQAHPRVVALGFGAADLAADLGCEMSWEPMLYPRSRMVQAAALARLALFDVPYLDIRNPEGLAAETRRVQALGFTGKLAIHPDQVPVIVQALLPTEKQVQDAHAIVAAAQAHPQGVCVLSGRMIDEPVVQSARRVIARSARIQ
jgi:citrate lyase beta subunit